VDQVPASPYTVEQTLAEYNIESGVRNDFLAILLDRLEKYYQLESGFSDDFIGDFEAFLGSVDVDDETEGVQPYADPLGNPILTLGDTLWFGPAVTWPKVLSNHPYIHFWHRLDRALLDAGIPGMGAEVLGDADWAALFSSGPLGEGEVPEIVMRVGTSSPSGFPLLDVDQLRTGRPANQRGSIGAIETMPSPAITPRECALECRADKRDCRTGAQGDKQACAAVCSAGRKSDRESCSASGGRGSNRCRRDAAAAARLCSEVCHAAKRVALDSCRALYETCCEDCTEP